VTVDLSVGLTLFTVLTGVVSGRGGIGSEILGENNFLELRPFSFDLITPRYVGWLNDPGLMRYSEQRHRVHTPRTCERWFWDLKNRGGIMWGVFLGDHIGNISVEVDEANSVADISILMSISGYGTGAFGLAADSLDYRKLTCGCMDANVAMKRVAEKNGFSEECRRKGQFLLDGAPVDGVYFARFR